MSCRCIRALLSSCPCVEVHLSKPSLTNADTTTMQQTVLRASSSAAQTRPSAVPVASRNVQRSRISTLRANASVLNKPDSGEGLTYKKAGVDIDAGDELVKRIQKMNPDIGGFGGLVPFGDSYLVAGTDGVGTKLKLAFDMNKHDTVSLEHACQGQLGEGPTTRVGCHAVCPSDGNSATSSCPPAASAFPPVIVLLAS